MPRDVAVDEPGAGVVRLEGDDDVAARGEQHDVAAGGVADVQGTLQGAVELPGTLVEDGEVVAVEVDLWVAWLAWTWSSGIIEFLCLLDVRLLCQKHRGPL